MITTGAFLLASVLAGFGSMEPIPGEERFDGLADDADKGGLAAGLGWGKIGEDQFLQLTLNTELNLGTVGFGFQIPLNLRIIDNDPKVNPDDYYGLLRREDWDHPADFLKVIRYVRYGHKRDPLYVRVGDIAGQIGHGTIMSRYINNLTLDTFRVGMELDVNTSYGGVETLVGDFGSMFADEVGSRIIGVRAFVKPVAFADPESIFNIFAVGFSTVTDMNAPVTIATQASANDPSVMEPVIENNQLVSARDRAQAVYGFDLEAEVLHSAILDVVPYTDLNFIQGAGWGWHLGTLVTAKMPIGFNLTVPVRLEYRRFKENYVPIYFSSFYEIERFNYPLTTKSGPSLTKSEAVRAMADDEGLNGYYGDLAFDFAGLLQVGAIYEDYDRGDPNLAVFLSVPALEVIQFKAYYTRTGITGTQDIFKLDERSLAIAEGRYQAMQFVYVVGRWTRRWQLVTDSSEGVVGEYESTDSWKFGVELALDF